MSALGRGGSTRRWRRIRAVVLDRDAHRCQVPVDADNRLCLAHADHVDHIRPRILGGSDDLANLRAACESHNLRRGAGRDLAAQVIRSRAKRWTW